MILRFFGGFRFVMTGYPQSQPSAVVEHGSHMFDGRRVDGQIMISETDQQSLTTGTKGGEKPNIHVEYAV